MDVKAGTTVGFATVLGGAVGAILGFFVGEVVDFKRPGQMAMALTAVGALTGAFVSGSFVAPSPPATSTATSAPQLIK
jgi:fluoride ion exporter CrcB/FEX